MDAIEATARAIWARRNPNRKEAFPRAGVLREVIFADARAAIAAYRDAEAKRSDRCEHCGSIVISYRSGCPGCGAPQCCQRCCDKAEIERLTAEQGAATSAGAWVCNHCGEILRPVEVTFEEFHDGCGGKALPFEGRDLLAEIAALRAKLEAAERDAERYREWKRAFREGECGLWNAICDANSDAEHDAAIDASRGGE